MLGAVAVGGAADAAGPAGPAPVGATRLEVTVLVHTNTTEANNRVLKEKYLPSGVTEKVWAAEKDALCGAAQWYMRAKGEDAFKQLGAVMRESRGLQRAAEAAGL